MFRRELRIFFTAVMFYTRIPCPPWVDHDAYHINLSIRYFPLIGWIVGSFSGLTFYLGSLYFSSPVAVILSLIVSVLLTGAFHEDGFADVCDAFGGGWTKEKILQIMKDSRLGTFGVAGLGLILSLKAFLILEFFDLLEVQTFHIILFFVVGHSLSRFIASTFVWTHPYARESNDSKAKPVAEQTGSINLFIGAIWGISPLLFWSYLADQYLLVTVVVIAYLSKFLLARYFNKWIGGYTGDCLGATQQVAEVVIYLSVILLWKFA